MHPYILFLQFILTAIEYLESVWNALHNRPDKLCEY